MREQPGGTGGSERDRVLAAIRGALARSQPSTAEDAAVAARLAHPVRNIVPARGRQEGDALVAQFIAEAQRVNAVVHLVGSPEAVPTIVAEFLRDSHKPPRLKLAPDRFITAIPWAREPKLSFSIGAANADDPVAVTSAYAGIGETGTLMLLSGPGNPINLSFLPEVHVVVLPTAWIVSTYEDAWDCLRAGGDPQVVPRVIDWISGPSRTADIEQTLLLGAHGPKQLLIVLIDVESRPPQS